MEAASVQPSFRQTVLDNVSAHLGVLLLATLAICLTISPGAWADEVEGSGNDADFPHVRVTTTEGVFEVRLRPDLAPETVSNFLSYVDKGFYDDTLFHRVIPGFMIQGGGFDLDMSQKATDDPVRNESRETAKNLRGTLAMARTNDPDSATVQFFINLVDNPSLNATRAKPGYTVFGKVTDGMGVVDAIAGMETTRTRGMADVPKESVVIKSIRLIEQDQ